MPMSDSILETRLRVLRDQLSLMEDPSTIACLFQQEQTDVDKAIWMRLDKEINKRVRRQKSEIKQLLNGLGDRSIAAADAWVRYVAIHRDSRDVFQEYLDFLNGLAFRQHAKDGLDINNICQVADELIWSCSKFVFLSPSLTVPAHQEKLVVTLGRIVRLPVAEWTIWSLPLIAHEFGHVVIGDDSNEKLRELIRMTVPQFLKSDPDCQVCLANARAGAEVRAAEQAQGKLNEYLADAFGTYMMGPAYACALIHLRLNPICPSGPDAENHVDHERAYVVLGMLKQMNAHTQAREEYKGILERLEKNWQEMVASANKAAAPGGVVLPQAQLQLLDEVVRAIWDRFYDHLTDTPLYPHEGRQEGWLVAKEWGSRWVKALQNAAPLTLPAVAVDSMLRDALNAAWFARIEQRDKADIIEPKVHELCQQIVARRPRSTASAARARQREE
jgi:hypothetical protein